VSSAQAAITAFHAARQKEGIGARRAFVFSIVRRHLVHTLGMFLCAALLRCAAEPAPVHAPAPQPAAPDTTDWGALLFPPRAAASVASEAAAAAREAPAAPPPVFGPSAYSTSDGEESSVFVDVAAFCRAQKQAAVCREIAVGVSFAGNAEFQAIRAVRVTASDFADSRLLVKIDRGLVPLPVSWNVIDPEDPGCPSIVNLIGIERVIVQRGMLVVVALGVNHTVVDVPEGTVGDTGLRPQMLRVVTVVKRVGDTLHTRSFDAYSGPPLGWKRQTRQDRFVPWDKLAWREWRDVHVRADGTLDVPDP
jgi:hypothetical protein